uniref:Inhibitor_I29 domain-containing protein n=1 Tax=Steinernema glaseri TaxID=37863 RepID=A0A1I7Z8T2_9BILA
MFSALLLLLPLAWALRPLSEEISQWESFVTRHQKSYETPQEEARRFAVFVANLRLAEERAAKELGSAVFGVDAFADLTPEEFRMKSIDVFCV